MLRKILFTGNFLSFPFVFAEASSSVPAEPPKTIGQSVTDMLIKDCKIDPSTAKNAGETYDKSQKPSSRSKTKDAVDRMVEDKVNFAKEGECSQSKIGLKIIVTASNALNIARHDHVSVPTKASNPPSH